MEKKDALTIIRESLSPEQQELLDIEIRKAELRGERRIHLIKLGWQGMTDEEISWVYRKYDGDTAKMPFVPTLEQVRKAMTDEKSK